MRKPGPLAMVVALAVLGATSVEAQGIVAGIKGGVSYSGVTNVEDVETSNEAAFVGGGFVGINPSGLLILGGEVLYAQRKVGVTEGTETGTVTQSRIDIPAYIGARFGRSAIRPRVYAGGAISFEVSCNISVSSAAESQSCTDVDFNTNSTVFDVLGGAGIALAVGSIIIDLDVRGVYGVTKLVDEVDDDSRLWGLYAMAGIGFPLGGP